MWTMLLTPGAEYILRSTPFPRTESQNNHSSRHKSGMDQKICSEDCDITKCRYGHYAAQSRSKFKVSLNILISCQSTDL